MFSNHQLTVYGHYQILHPTTSSLYTRKRSIHDRANILFYIRSEQKAVVFKQEECGGSAVWSLHTTNSTVSVRIDGAAGRKWLRRKSWKSVLCGAWMAEERAKLQELVSLHILAIWIDPWQKHQTPQHSNVLSTVPDNVDSMVSGAGSSFAEWQQAQHLAPA